MLPVIGALRPWADPELLSLHRLAAHVPLPADAGSRRSLNGRWAFELFDTPESVPASAVEGGTPTGGLTVAVPGNWTMQGLADLPHYTNVQMPFPGPPPTLPPRNPTGVYRRRFTVPAGWRRQQVVLHVAGAESVHAVYVNGTFVGYGTDSRLPSEYDITAALRPGANELAIVVVRYSAQSYVEDQDQWWMAGLHREVLVETRPLVHVADVRCIADLRMVDGAGLLSVATTVGFVVEPAAGWLVRTWAETLAGKRVDLTAREFDLLLHFARNPGRLYTRAQLLDAVWGYTHESYEHNVNTHINRLRAKIERDPAEPRYILTARGVGYRFTDG